MKTSLDIDHLYLTLLYLKTLRILLGGLLSSNVVNKPGVGLISSPYVACLIISQFILSLWS